MVGHVAASMREIIRVAHKMAIFNLDFIFNLVYLIRITNKKLIVDSQLNMTWNWTFRLFAGCELFMSYM